MKLPRATRLLLGLQGSKEDAEAIKSRLGAFLRDHLKLELSPEKTLVTHARSQPARFLGYDVAVMHSDTRRSLNGHIELRLPPDVLEEKCSRYMHHRSSCPRVELTTDSDFDIVALYGAEYRGIVQYYALARNVTWFHRLHWAMSGSLLKTLASKHRSTVREMARRYASKAITSSGVRRCFQVTVEREGKPPLVARFGGIALKYDRNATISDEMPKIFVCGTELIQRLLADRCEICGSRVDVEVHHIRQLRDLKIPGLKERPFHVQRMAARRRKTLVVCAACHKKIHQGQLLADPSLAVIEVTGEPDAWKLARPVRRGADGKGPSQSAPRQRPTLREGRGAT